jgi:hypothetical protein
VRSNITIVSSSLTATSSVTILGGSLLASNSLIQVGPSGAGLLTISGGDHVIGRLKLGGGATNSRGEFVISGGKLRILGNGSGPGNGLVVNSAEFEGGDTDGTGTSVTIGDAYSQHAVMHGGSAEFTAMYVGSTADGTYNQSGGSMTMLSNLMVGAVCPASPQDAIGTVDVSGGWLFITNATHTAILDVRNGTFTLEPGAVLVVDNLVATNACGHFINNGGVILAGNAYYTDNLLLNPGVDIGSLDHWSASGTQPPVVSGFFPHAGHYDVFDFLSTGDFGYLSQTVDLLQNQSVTGITADTIDFSNLVATVSFWELTVAGDLTFGPPYDDAQVIVQFKASDSSVIRSVSTPELDGYSGYWTNYTGQYDVPSGTRLIDYIVQFVPNTAFDQVYVDDNLLFVSASPAPPLRVVKDGNNAVLSWPAWAANFALQSSTSLKANSWQYTGEVPVAASGRLFVTNPIVGPRLYYRLRGK